MGSSSGWSGDLRADAAALRILDVAVENEDSRRVAVVIAPSPGEEPLSPMLEAEAVVEWGATDGTSQRAEVDVGAGTAFGITGTRLIVSLRAMGATAAHPQKSRYRATASLGDARELFPPLRAVRFGALAVGALSDVRAVPAFARRLSLVRTPQGAAVIRFFDTINVEIGTAFSDDSSDREFIVAPGARFFLVENFGVVPLANFRAVFQLGFGG
jgi:hypothetical protein